jgi:hypothetical protein
MKYLTLVLWIFTALGSAQAIAASTPKTASRDAWEPARSIPGGLLAKRVNLWRSERMWYLVKAENEYLISGFETQPGTHPWQGEHLGKWLEQISAKEGALPMFKVKNPKIVLQPYFSTGGLSAGPQTYFQLSKNKKAK